MNNDALFNWMERELYPALFDNMANVLPEFEFKRVGSKWISTNTLKINGEAGSSKGKVYVYANTPGLLKDWRVGAKPIVKYLMERRNKTYFEVVEALSRTVNLKPPTNPDFNPKAYEEHQRKLNILELCNKHFIDNLSNPEKAIEVVTYLQSRGFTVEEAKAMEIGCIISQSDLILYLKKNGYSEELINETLDLKADTRIGNTHKLTIPFRSGGSLKGFKFRTTGDTHPKYINSKDLDINGGFFNLLSINGDKDITIVEGEIDALHATLKGVENVVATGGRSINALQVRDAIRKGVKSFTLCLDNDPGKEEETRKAINRAIDTILNEGVNKIYVVTLEPGEAKIDPDTLIKEQGVEAFKELLRKHTPHYLYRLNNIFIKYSEIEKKENRELTFKEIDNLLEEVVNLSTTVSEPFDRDMFKKMFLKQPFIKGLGITEEAIEATLKKISYNKNKEEAIRELNSSLSKVATLQQKGELKEAIETLEGATQKAKIADKEEDFKNFLIPNKRDDLVEAFKNEKEAIDTGYTIQGEPTLAPSGALSFIVAPTSHGKTTMLINLALGVVEKNKDKKVFFFSYEEPSKDIRASFLNSYIGRNYPHAIGSNTRRSIKHYFKTGSTEMIRRGQNDSTGELEADYREDFKKLEREYFKLEESGNLNVSYSDYTALELIELIRYLHKNTNVGAIFIDYIQMLRLGATKHKIYSRQEEVKEVCTALKDVAVETGLPIVIAGQFNRTVKNPLHLHPTNIGEAGDIERVANLIIGLWNNKFKVVGDKDEIKRIEEENLVRENTLFVEVLKNRAGEVGLKDWLEWNGNTGTIKNIPLEELEKEDYYNGLKIEEAGAYKKNNINFGENPF